MAGRDARFERPPCMRGICGGTCNVTAGLCDVCERTLEPSVPTSQSKAGHDAKRGGNGGEDGDEDLQDFAPDG